jgi:antitoxin (DNA-binding transcriptional repressor) of toxin-antitoxin stability system
MADDLKISEMVEVTAGNLEDNMQMEVYDPNEAAAEDQNKRIRFDTLEGIFGAEDKIFEGDSSVEVIDTGTGEVVVTVDGNPILDITAAGLKFGFGSARVDLIETAITDDDTRIPTSGAVIDALAADVKDIISEGDTSVEVIDVAGGQVVVTVDGNPIFDVLAAGLAFATGARVDTIETTLTDDDTHLPTSGAVIDAIAAVEPDTLYFSSSPRIATRIDGVTITGTAGINTFTLTEDGFGGVVINNPTDGGSFTIKGKSTLQKLLFNANPAGPTYLYYNGTQEGETASGAWKATNGFIIGSSGTMTDIETTLTDDDTHLPTSGAVIDAIAAISIPDADKIIEGNSSVEVIDTGTGQVDTTVDGSLKARMNADGLQLKGDQTGAEAIGNAATTVAVTFGTAHADANYQVLVTVENLTDVTVLSAMITAKATTGFTATLSAATGTANYVLNWMVLRS